MGGFEAHQRWNPCVTCSIRKHQQGAKRIDQCLVLSILCIWASLAVNRPTASCMSRLKSVANSGGDTESMIPGGKWRALCTLWSSAHVYASSRVSALGAFPP